MKKYSRLVEYYDHIRYEIQEKQELTIEQLALLHMSGCALIRGEAPKDEFYVEELMIDLPTAKEI